MNTQHHPQAAEPLAAFDAAIAAELLCVSTVEYNSHEICKFFAKNFRERLAATPGVSQEGAALAVKPEVLQAVILDAFRWGSENRATSVSPDYLDHMARAFTSRALQPVVRADAPEAP